MYEPSHSIHGDPLYYLIQDNWDVFDERLFESGGAADLIEDIFIADWDDDDGEPPTDANELYVTAASNVDYIERFEEFLEHTREGADVEPAFPEILREDIWRFEEQISNGTILHRARLGWQDATDDQKHPWAGPNIGASPVGYAARANRGGRVVLYCADHMKTAIAEVRPARGLLVSVCQIRVDRDISVLDLTRPKEAINPFLVEEGLLSYWLELDELLTRIAWTLAKPLERDDNPLDYRPSQRLSEFAENVGFSGIRYPSAMDKGGTNLVIFDPRCCSILESRLVKVTEVNVAYTEDTFRLTDDFPEL